MEVPDMALRSNKNPTDGMEGVRNFLVAFIELRTFISMYAELTKKLHYGKDFGIA
jgi:hypothetical protein